MTVHAVLADPPRPGLVLPELVETAPLDEEEAAQLYAAMLQDTLLAMRESGGELLVNYPPEDALPEKVRNGSTPRADLEQLVDDALGSVDDVRFEVQVGSTFDGRAGNTATHLLREEDVESVALLDPRAPTVTRVVLDEAAMKLRRSEAVIGPGAGGRAFYLGLSELIDFDGAYTPPEVVTITERCVDGGCQVDFLPMHPIVETGTDLVSLVSIIEARRQAERIVPRFTMDAVDHLGLAINVEDDGREVVRTGASRPGEDAS